MQTKMDYSSQAAQYGRPVSHLEAARANEYFEQFLNATSLKQILGYYRGLIDYLHLKPNVISLFYAKLRSNLTSWRAKALWKKFDARAAHKCYQKGKIAANTRVLIIGGGPCGLRTAIEAQLLGAKVVIIEKRDRFSRNNVLHLWPFVIEDLRMLGAKKFFGKFCAGAIDHISIRQLQCILLKVALLLGVEVHTEVGFEKLIEPSAIEKTGWRAEFKPANHPVSQYEFDVIIGADGKRNTLQGFTRKEFRGKLAIAITANFINKRTEAEARVEEISGVAFIFNQKFFKDLLAETRIDLENIVYYKDDTHYFVMTAKKASLLEKGVIKQDLSDTDKLLAPENVNREALEQYAIEAANFSTNHQMSDMEFAVNHYGQPDIAMFDFTSMYAAENASKVLERNGHRLLMILVGDSLLEPFWPTGSGCARGFLSALDAAWATRSWSAGASTPLDVMAERESIYRLLAQTTPDNLNKDWKSYTLDPATRYPNLNKAVVLPHQVACLYDTDTPASIDRMKRASKDKANEVPKKRKRGTIDNDVLLFWLAEQLKDDENIKITDIGSVFKDGRILCSIIHHYRPDLLDISSMITDEPIKNNQLAIDILEKELGIPPVMTGADITNTDDYLAMAGYLTEIYDTFRGEIPHIKHPKLKLPAMKKSFIPTKIKTSTGFHDLKLKPCKKCSDAYNSEIKLCATGKSETHKRKLCTERLCAKCTDIIGIKSTKLTEKNVEVVFFKPDIRRKCKKCLMKKQSTRKNTVQNVPSVGKKPSKLEVQKKESVEIALKLDEKNNNESKQVNIDKEFLKKYAQARRDKFKKFMTNLVLKRKITTSRKCSLSVIPETKIVETREDEKKLPANKKVDQLQFELEKSPSQQITNSEIVKLQNNINILNVNTIFNNNVIVGESNMYSASKVINDDKIVIDPKSMAINKSETAKSLGGISETESLIRIQLIERETSSKYVLQKIEFISSSNQLTISSKIGLAGNPAKSRSSSSRNYAKYRPKTCQYRKFLGPNISNAPGNISNNMPVSNYTCQIRENQHHKFLSKRGTMFDGDGMHGQIYSRVSNWISSNDFLAQDNSKADTEVDTVISNSRITDITSVSKMGQYDDVKVEERTDVVNFSDNDKSQYSEEKLTDKLRTVGNKSVRTLSKFSQYSPFQYCGSNLKSSSAPPKQFSVIAEGEEVELPESVKISELSFKTIRTANAVPLGSAQPRPSSRHKRHAEMMVPAKPVTADRKTRKRRTLERVGPSGEDRQKTLDDISSNRADRHNRRRQQRKFQTEQFVKSMQMLQANAKADAQPFEDYSIFLYRQTAPKFEDRVKDLEKQFTYIPDHENKSSSQTFRGGGGADDDLAARIKSLENKWQDPVPVEKKPKDLLRSIGKIEISDWNIKEIEKKILENKLGKPNKAVDREKVPKWSKEQFLARQTKMEKQHLERQDSSEAKFADIDKNIKNLDQKLKEGTVRELGQNKVATITEKLVSKVPAESKPVEKSPARPPPILPVQGGSDSCHFCGQRVYLMERLSTEGRFFHHGCFKCQFCHTQLRLGSYAFDRDGLYGNKFFCLQHYGMIGEAPPVKVTRKPSVKIPQERRSPEKRPYSGIAGVDLLDKVHTPERIEFANLSVGQISSDHDDSCQMDEDEWTDKNFGASCAELDDTDDDSSSMSDTDSDDDNAYDDALEEPVTKEGTMKWAERWKNSYSRKKHNAESNGYSSSDQSSYCENSSDDDDSETATEGEEEIRARELRKKEVCVEPPIVHTDTGTDTEIVSDEKSSDTSSEIRNSATEISTDSEFAQDDPTPTREIPPIVLNDFYVTKSRGSGRNVPKKIQVTTGYLQKPLKNKTRKPHVELKLKPLVSPLLLEKLPAPGLHTRTEGYVLNRTQSTGGIATKVSLELKKKYLLGEDASGSIQKSGSASTLDTKFKSFQTNISDCQKMLKPSAEISSSMQTFCNLLNGKNSPQPTVISSKGVTNETGSMEVVSDTNKPSTVPDTDTYEFENESEGRPRSPLHETSIIVPQIDWSKKDQTLSSDSLATSDSDEDDAHQKKIHNIPRVEVHPVHEEPSQEFALDSLCVDPRTQSSLTDPPKSIASEKKTLNQPKTLPNLENLLPEIHNSLHNKYKALEKKTFPESAKPQSGLSSPESEQATTALTETELSDWARDEVVSDDFEDGDFEVNEEFQKTKSQLANSVARMAEFDDVHIGREISVGGELKDKIIITEAMNNILSGNLDIEFMDTGSETSSEDGIVDSQNGYVLLKNDNEFAEDSLDPTVNEILEATNIYAGERIEKNHPVEQFIEADTARIAKLNDQGDDESIVNIETGTTTEENTCSDSTVKNVTEIGLDKQNITRIKLGDIASLLNENVIEKLAMSIPERKQTVDNTTEFQEHCQRLQSKVEFSNVKDSIDVRKSRRKSKPDLIQGDSEQLTPQKGVNLTLTPTTHTPDILYNKETLKKERDTNQRLIQEMVMNKMKAENKSLERKKRRSTALGQTPTRESAKSATADITSKSNNSSHFNTPDVLLSTNYPLKNSKSVNISSNPQSPKVKVCTTTDNKNIFDNKIENVDGATPKPPPRQNRPSDDVTRKLEKLKNSVRSTLEQENVEPIRNLDTAVIKADKRSSWLHSNATPKKETTAVKRRQSGNYELATPAFNNPFSCRTKSTPDFPQKFSQSQQLSYEKETMKVFNSDPNIPDGSEQSRKKNKDPERRKSFSKIFSTIFSKKSPNASGSKSFFSKLSPKMKEISKSCSNLDRKEDSATTEPMRKKSLSESFIYRTITPPPVPPLPLNYEIKKTDESSEGEQDYKKLGHSSCDTLDQTDLLERSTISLNEKRSSKSRRASRQTQYKRHRMAQEIQRKLEETEVKIKELERRGVSVEKAIRGEDGDASSDKEDFDLMQEWFDLMRDRTELRRYERELTVRAQELELEDRHARLQHELRERIEDSKAKNEDDLKLEQSIISEMIEIVEKRDSLIAEIEEDRIRYSNEDRGVEEQMLAKGLRLTPLKKPSEK